MSNTRALAAQALADIALNGASLREVLARCASKLRDPRDRALLTALLNDSARWWLRFDAALERLVSKPLRRTEPDIHALLVLGLVQLEILKLKDYAAVAATVQATRALKRPHLAGLVNAVLRRWQRKRAALLVELDAQPSTRYAMPPWLVAAITADWPDKAGAVLADSAHEPPLMLRVNRRRTTRDALLQALHAAGYAATAHPWLTDGLVLPHSLNITRLPGFAQGQFAVQDGAAQVAADLLDVQDGQRVLDACAAPGGKACHLLERANLALTAVEVDSARAVRIGQNLQRLGLKAQLSVGDASDPSPWWDGQFYERILIDAPCSATGVLRRRPDVRLNRRASDIATLAAQQRRMLAALWPLLAPRGRMVYVTCSMLHAENEAVIQSFLTDHPKARAVPFTLPVGQAATVGWQILPGDGDLDGMYYAIIERHY